MKLAEIGGLITPVVVALLALAGTIWGKRLSRRTDAAEAARTNSEAKRNEVETARGLIEEVKELYAEQRTLNVEQRVEYEARLANTRGELTALAERFKTVEVRQAALIAALAAHAPWDFAAYEALKTTYTGYPPPPPLDPEPIVSLRRRPQARHRDLDDEPPPGEDEK